MWKKLWICLIALIPAITVGYAFLNDQMNAKPSSLSYYQIGEVFERTNSNTITMGGYQWKVVHIDNNNAWIMSIDNLSPIVQCPNTSDAGGNWVWEASYNICMNKVNSYFTTNANSTDDMGEYIKYANNIGTLQSPTVNQYMAFTKNETYFTEIQQFDEFYLDTLYPSITDGAMKHLVYSKSNEVGVESRRPILNGNKSKKLIYAVDTSMSSEIRPLIEIKLPQKGVIKNITTDKTSVTKSFTDPINDTGSIMISIDTMEGEGPYHFYLYDTDSRGNGTYTTPSNYFDIVPDAVNGTAQIGPINKLPVGDYYFKVKVVDESTNEHLYYTPSDFTKDPYRSKETGVIHVQITKASPTIVFDDPNQTKKSVQDAGTNTNWNETATANPFNSDLQIKYTIVSGDIGLIDLDENTGAVTYKGNGAFGKVKIRATVDDDPATGMDNYNSAYVEKEIVVYREVDGVVTPHANSSDANVPTFQANDANVKTGGTIGTIKGTLGTPDTIGGTTTTYSYAIKSGGNGSFFTVNASNGEIKTNANLAVGSYTFMITVSDKWSSKDIPVTVNVGMAPAEVLNFYENSTSNTIINQKTVNFTDTNISVYATVKGSTNNNPVTYYLKAGEPTNVIDVNPNSGVITIKGAGTVILEAEKKGDSGQADAYAQLTFTVTAASQNFIYTTDSTLNTERPKTGNKYDALVESYAPSKTFQLYTTGNPSGSTVTYQLKTGSPSDVISVDPSGQVTILNASMNNQIGKVIVEATSHDPSGNYSDKTIELPINIEKGTRVVDFVDHPIYVLSGSGSVTPNVETDGVLDTSGTAVIEIDPSEDSSIAWTNDGVTIQYNWSDAQGKDIKIKVTKPADRNYKAADGTGILHILGADENVLTLSTPGKIIYGDHFTIKSTQDDSASSNVQYTFETDNQVFVSVPQVNGNKAEFDALAYSGSTEISIKVTRMADGELPLTKTVKIKVLPKPITIEIENKDKLRLEDNPPLTYKDFTSDLVSWNGVVDYIDPSYIQLSTTAGKYSPIGSYPITSGNAQKQLNDNYPNYTFTIKDGLLNVKDNGNKDFWDSDGDGCLDLNIKLEDGNGNTILINGDRNDDGIPDYNIDKDGDGIPDLDIDTDNDGKPDVNLVILDEWKPTKCVTVNIGGRTRMRTAKASDPIQYATGINAQPEINIDLDGDLIPDIDIDNKGDFKPHLNISKDGKTASVNIAILHDWIPDHDYQVGNFQYDSIDEDEPKPYLNIDTDGDGRPDVNIDLDGDGVADINIDTDGDLIPNVDIDSTGDGKPDINVDSDGDGKPDENLMDITEWKPEQNVDHPFEYDTIKIEKQNDSEDDGMKDENPDKEVQGSYYPGTNTGGALTGDTSNLLLYMGIGFSSLSLLFFLLFKYKREENN